MPILVELLAVVGGLIYIAYKGFKEERKTTIRILISIVLLLLPCLLVLVMAGDDPEGWEGIIVFLIWIIEGIVAIKANNKRREKINDPKNVQIRKEEIFNSFRENGYSVSKNLTDILVDDHLSPLYKSDRFKVPINECYKWLCDKRAFELSMMEDAELDKLLGVQLKDIPLNEKIDIGKAIWQRKAYAVMHILNADGLMFLLSTSSLHPYMSDESYYRTIFLPYVANNKS